MNIQRRARTKKQNQPTGEHFSELSVHTENLEVTKMHQVQIATPKDFEKLLPAFRALRPHRSEAEILTMLPLLYEEGYQVAYIGDEQTAFAVLGFRILNFLYSGKTLYIDDLSTVENHRKNGYAAMLFDFIKQYAKEQNCDHLSLDSGFTRNDAHRFYLNQGLIVESLHFGKSVNSLS